MNDGHVPAMKRAREAAAHVLAQRSGPRFSADLERLIGEAVAHAAYDSCERIELEKVEPLRDRYERLAYRARAVVSAFELRGSDTADEHVEQAERFEQAVANLEVELAQGDLGAPRSPLAEAVDEVTELRPRCKLLESALRELIANIEHMAGFEIGTLHPNDFGVRNAKKALGDARPTMATEAERRAVAQDLASEEGAS